MSKILDQYLDRRVKIVYKDGTDDNGNPKIKTLVAQFLAKDDIMGEFLLDEGTKTAIALSDIVRVTEKAV